MYRDQSSSYCFSLLTLFTINKLKPNFILLQYVLVEDNISNFIFRYLHPGPTLIRPTLLGQILYVFFAENPSPSNWTSKEGFSIMQPMPNLIFHSTTRFLPVKITSTSSYLWCLGWQVLGSHTCFGGSNVWPL